MLNLKMQKQKSGNNVSWNAKDYQKHSRAQQAWARELIVKLNLRGDEHMLDVGCGDGKITAEIAGYLGNGSITGVDNSAAMIELAGQNFPHDKYPNISFLLMDANELLYTEKFDIVFSNAVLHWIHEHKPVLNGMYRALVPGGRILLQMGGKGNARDIIKTMQLLQSGSDWQCYFQNFEFPYFFPDCHEYSLLLAQAGFRIQRVELLNRDVVYNDRAGLAGWIRTTWMPYTDRIPENMRDQFIEQLITEYLKQTPPDGNGQIHVAMVRLEVEAVKI
jgi:trans-aconitate 2-methyltransferase